MADESYGLIECEKTMLPFRSTKRFYRTKDLDKLAEVVSAYAKRTDTIVVDDFGYCITDLYMRHSWGDEEYRDQFKVYKEIGGRVYRFIEFVNDLEGDVIVYLIMHTDTDAMGNLVPATVGKLLNEKVNLLGMVNVCILAESHGGEYKFIVDGKPPAKSCGAFASAEQPNDLNVINRGLREFMGWSGDNTD
jgi:hypothetical protein